MAQFNFAGLPLSELVALRTIVSSQKLTVTQKLLSQMGKDVKEHQENEGRLAHLQEASTAIESQIFDRCLALGITL